MALQGLIFDFDGLLVDTESAILSAWQTLHTEDGMTADPAVMHAIVGHVDVDADLWRAYPLSHDRAALDVRLQTLARRLCREAPLRPGVQELLDAAAAAGLRCAVASNSTHPHVDGHLSVRGLRDRFTAVVCREDVPRGKPAPDVYLAALRALDLPPEDVIAFEDSMPGHEAAAAAGLRVAVVPNPTTVRDPFPHATWRYASLADFTREHFARSAGRV
ncbi:MAG: HAD-IA family hydrolase [Opitutaceae bacterium]|jgi:putative hydrolase of the HAD superfamily|nr:HAD-IA family hydrolase [Opitutaceae bacterium]